MSNWDQKSDFEALIARNGGRLTAIARTYAGFDSDDLLQEILLQVWRGMAGFQKRSSIDTWCYRVALNTAITWRRSKGRRNMRLPSGESDVEQVAGGDDGRDDCDLLRKFLQTLNDADRALVLVYLEDLSGAEMADILGISPGALRVRIHRVKRRLEEWKVDDHEFG